MTASFAHPDLLVDVQWVRDHGKDPGVRLVEVDVDPSLYEKGHVEGAVGWNWQVDLCDTLRRDIVDVPAFEKLCGAAGITRESTVILYGDANNWFACWALWQFKMHGHKDVRIMNGGRVKWEKEGLPYVTTPAKPAPATYKADPPDFKLRAFRPKVEEIVAKGGANLVDVRSPDEFSGKVNAPPGLQETSQRSGRIPRAVNIPWAMAVREDGTFKSVEDLRALYEGRGVTPDRDTVAYCRIGERSSHTWFVLKYLLGYPNVTNYDGSWTEWGNLIGAPIEKG